MRFKETSFLLVSLFILALCFSGCATTTRETGDSFYMKASQVELGMTQHQVVAIIGTPTNIYSNFNAVGLYETWTYTAGKPYWIFVFQNGRLISVSH
jgi:outer membrane protein assembly factor BamE (lipoprotein component of BamABCDE complex)